MNLAPLGMAASEPPMPTGRIGAPVRDCTNAGPSNMCASAGPVWRVPSGNITRDSPRSITSTQVRNASRSAVPRATGKPPRAVNSRPHPFDFQSVSLPM